MFRTIVFLMIVIPALEIWGLIKAAQFIGGVQTFLAVILTGVIGAFLAKKEGLKTWNKAQIELRNGQLPGDAILDGISIFAGGLLLLTPGFFTDTIGFFMIFPVTRKLIKGYLKRWLERKIQTGRWYFYDPNSK
ncbi:FxsA family protein [Tepidibacillus infernus]|uniref:FxsA family protein n=1 Tax=Tepidibacillus infernus TaxID=1806172 RepID=UPI003B711D99